MADLVLVPWWLPLASGLLLLASVAGSAWFDHYSKKRLAEAATYWRRSRAVWDAIDARPEGQISEEGLRAMEAFISSEVDQVGSLPHDYRRGDLA